MIWRRREFLCFVEYVSLYNPINKSNWCTILISMFIYFLYMFRPTMCPSSEETTLLMRHLVLVILYGWLSGMQGGTNSTLHTRQSSIQNNKYQVSHKFSNFFFWWAHSRPKHVEKRNKHTKKNCAPSWLYLHGNSYCHLITGGDNCFFICGAFPNKGIEILTRGLISYV
jgi:hypothetical protein